MNLKFAADIYFDEKVQKVLQRIPDNCSNYRKDFEL